MSQSITIQRETERPSQSMDFMQFVSWSTQILQIAPGTRRLCETRIASSFQNICPVVEVPSAFATVHRCDVALHWCETRGLSSLRARTTLACEGVRHGLRLIFTTAAQRGQRIALPHDVYPVYWRIAAEVGVEAVGVETFPRFELRSIFQACARSGTSIVVLPAPLKLHGRSWTGDETDQAIAWLREEPRRRLILDGAYSFGLPLMSQVKRLLETDQVIYLDSLSKGWLHELVFGVAVVPARDFAVYADRFQSPIPSQEKLFRARALLTRHNRFPVLLRQKINGERRALQRLIDETGLRALTTTQGYFVGIEADPIRLFEEYQLLTIPGTVFGSALHHWSIASALPSRDQS